ncbi:uncharacterized protein [Phaseolus vulgaris]|uniref:uncharacterized protein n=1 Tax=Phaseolus vulgaris TaxID=3885 RepID=UPI0035CC14C8
MVERQIEGRTFKLGKSLDQAEQDQVAGVIARHLDAFAWSTSDMPGIDPDFLCHRLTMDPKNAGATYERLMDRVLAPMMGNVQAYVDDMVVTLQARGQHVSDLEELFATMAKYQLKLNPEKCVFGIEAGKFLGFLLTERGIEANPEKCATILAMRSPASVKEVQQLTGQMAALSKFVSVGGEKGHPYFQCLRRNTRFVWTTECEEAFFKLKEYMATPPVLCKPQLGALLRLYFVVMERAISSVLIQEQDQAALIEDLKHVKQSNAQYLEVLSQMETRLRILEVQRMEKRLSKLELKYERSSHSNHERHHSPRHSSKDFSNAHGQHHYGLVLKSFNTYGSFEKKEEWKIHKREDRSQHVILPFVQSVKVPSFSGNSDPNVYLDWEAKCEQIFKAYGVYEDQKVLQKSDVVGRMVCWAVELSEFDVQYESQGPIKGQVFADFLVELSSVDAQQEEEASFRWVLSMDGSSNQQGSGAGVILEGSNGLLIEQALMFAFKASNNQAEYEALITGMLLIKEMGARSLLAKSNSLLVKGQVTGEYQAKDPQMVAYLGYVQILKGSFAVFELVHVPREQHARADLLAKLASSGKGEGRG